VRAREQNRRRIALTVLGETEMKIAWGRFSQKSGKQLRAGWLITAGVIAIYIGAIEP
jgi:hypothetical protein